MNYELKIQNSKFKIRKSWVFAWLFVFSAAGVAPVCTGVRAAGSIITGLHKEKFLNWEDSSATGIALVTGHGGELYALFDAPPRLVVWKSSGATGGESGDISGLVRAPTDLVSDGGVQLLVVDPWLEHIVRLNRKLQLLPPVIPVNVSGQDFEPVSICRVTDGTLFVVNRADDDVWRINRDGRTAPLGWSPVRSGRLDKPFRIDYAASIDRMLILDDDEVKLTSPYGAPDLLIKTSLTQPVGIGVNHDEAWLVGDGLSCISLARRAQTFFVPLDSLVAWGIYPAVDVASSDDQRLYLLPENGGQVLVMKVERSVEGHP